MQEMDNTSGKLERPTQTPSRNWADHLVKVVWVYYCVCGAAALILDAAYAKHSGRFTIISPYSLPVMKWLITLGFCGSLVAYVGYPRRPWSRIGAVVLCLTYAIATAVVWLMSLNPPDWARWS